MIKIYLRLTLINKNMSDLKFLKEKFAYDVMSVPTYSGREEMIIEFIQNWANLNNIKCILDDSKNVYLTKGELNDGEYYPCVTSHMDSVQTNHVEYINRHEMLPIKSRLSYSQKTELYVDGMGIGGDDKCGILVSLSLFEYFDKLKAVFFVSEETGCIGSKAMNKSFFDNVGYVIGWDSPDVNRNAWSCSGQKLFSYDFYEKYMKDVCDTNGRTKFYSEPFTDVVEIRENIDIICMNFGSGGYNAHSLTEYAVLEDMDVSIKFGKELIESLGNNKYYFMRNQSSYSYKRLKKDENGKYIINENGEYVYDESDAEALEDNKALAKLGDTSKYSNYPIYNWNGDDDDDDDVYDYYHNQHQNYSDEKERVLEIIEEYENYIQNLKDNLELCLTDIDERLNSKFQELGVEYDDSIRTLIEEAKDVITDDIVF